MRLVDFALLLCPREFREGYRREFRRAPASQALNLAWTGVALRFESVARDATFALRSLAKAPLFTVVVIVTLALALSVNAAVFSLINTLLLKPLPFNDPGRLAFVCGSAQTTRCAQMKNGEIGAIRKRATAFDGVAAFQNWSYTLTGFGVPQSLLTAQVSANFFDVLNVHPRLGRFFTTSDARAGVQNVVISDSLWRSVFNGAANVVGRTISLDGESWRVIGVAPPATVVPTPFGDKPQPQPYQAWVALPESSFSDMHGMHDWAFARLRPGVSEAQANAQVARIATELREQYPALEKDLAIRAQSFSSFFYSGVRPLLFIALATVLAVLLIACVNVANLLLVRATTRQSELALRNALGAARRKIIQQLAVEIAMLACAGGALGLVLAWYELKIAAALNISSVIPDLDKTGIDVRVAGFTFGAALIGALLAGVLPAALASGRAIAIAMRAAGRNASSSRTNVRNGLGAVQIALAFAIIIASLFLFRSFMTIAHADIGMNSRNMYVALVNLYAARWDDPGTRERFVERAIAELQRIPAVDGAYATRPSFWGGMGTELDEFRLPGKSYSEGTGVEATVAQSTPGFLRALHVPLLRGRSLEKNDTASTQRVAVVDAHFVREYFPGRNVLGTSILLQEGLRGTFVPVRIVGIVGSITRFGVAADPVIYIPNAQFPTRMPELFIHLRTPDPQLREHIARAIAAVDPQQAVMNVYSEEGRIDLYRGPQETSAVLVGTLAILALVLALAGIYGITAYTVQQREHEIGVRMAIGATARAVLRNVVAGGLRIALAGIAMGVVLSALAVRAISGMLFQTSVFDPLLFVSAMAILLTCVTFACAVPALRAAGIDPAKALRYE